MTASCSEHNEHAAAISATPAGDGYWIFTDRGRVLPYGNAAHFGDMAGTKLNGPILDSVATPTGRGYWMVASDGGIFAFGDAGRTAWPQTAPLPEIHARGGSRHPPRSCGSSPPASAWTAGDSALG